MNEIIPAWLWEKLPAWEGEVLHAYDDLDPKARPVSVGAPVKGTLTIGVGHTGADVHPGMTITKEQSRAFLAADLGNAVSAVREAVKVPLNENQFGALVCFVFNIGGGAFRKSTLLKKLNAGDYAGAEAEFKRWNKSNGKVLPGLEKRRADEAALFAAPVAPKPAPAPEPLPVPTVATGFKALVLLLLALLKKVFRK